MRILTSWLREFVAFATPVETLAEDLTMTGLEVEGIEDVYAGLGQTVVGRIRDVTPHPRAENLKVCQVDVGERTVQVVCGAPNLEGGLWVALALPGTALFDGQSIQATDFHGLPSGGMLCSEAELGIGEDRAGVMVLESSPGLRPGTRVVDALRLTDWVLEVSVTPNRPDCLSVLGVAREVAAIYGLSLKGPEVPTPVPVTCAADAGPPFTVTIEAPDLCGRYAAALVEGVVIGPSPVWLRRRLAASGFRPVNNVVDITNYVLLERGQPLHAFDFDRLAGGCIVVRRARGGEALTTLDGRSRPLQREMLVIADAERPVAVAGVMGGANSEVGGGTGRVLIESAWFAPEQVRRSGRALRLSTESSYRFERGTDPQGVVPALERAVALLRDVVKARPVSPIEDRCPRPYEPRRLTLQPSRTNGLLGTQLTPEAMAEILVRIGFQAEPSLVETAGRNTSGEPPFADVPIHGTVPSFRLDLKEEIDLVEEVARLHGFARIPTRMPRVELTARPPDALERLTAEIRSVLRAQGMDEVISYSFCAPKDIEALRLTDGDPRSRTVRLRNPLSEEQAVLRTTLLACLLPAVARNQARRNLDLRLFEMGTVFLAQGAGEQPLEELRIAGIWAGGRHLRSWSWPREATDLFDLKGVVETLLDAIGLSCWTHAPATPEEPYYSPGTSMRLKGAAGGTLGTLGQIAPACLKAWDIEGPVFAFDISVATLEKGASGHRMFRPLPRHPAVERDVAIIVPDTLPAQELLDFISAHAPPVLEAVSVFDVYRGRPIREGFKSVGLNLRYRAEDHTLSEDEANTAHDPMVHALLDTFKAGLRA